MDHFNETYERIQKATNTRTQVELAELLCIRQSSVSDAKRRKSVPSDWIVKLFEQFGLNPDWLKQGIGPMYLRTEQGYQPVEGPLPGVSEEPAHYASAAVKSQVVPVFSTSEGEEDAPPTSRLCIPQSFAMPGLKVLRADFASMEPFIRKGAYVGVNTEEKRITSGELYALRVPCEGLTIKRAFIDAGNKKLLLRCEDPAHPELTLPFKDHEKIVVGRVHWVLQKL